MFTLGPRGHIWIALTALVVAVSALATVVAHDNQQPTAESPVPGAEEQSTFDEPTSECGEDRVVFARNFSSGGQGVFVDLPQGVYEVKVYASEAISDLGYQPSVSVFGRDAQGHFVSNTVRDKKRFWLFRRQGPEVAGSLIPAPGGVARVSLGIDSDTVDQADQWRWEIIAPGVCAAPVEPDDEDE
ncbi:MAG: hypothetical protein OXT70_06665 [Chloroflexota bacterium]|nr:hypothetical protein [Chloroflexota bacterium]